MTTQLESIPLYGAPGSPYTRKMTALLRYRRLPYRLLVGESPEAFGFPSPKVPLLPTFFLPDGAGKTAAVTDSTPILRRLEEDYPDAQRSVIPHDPVIAFFDYLLEDYGDEWLTKAMFHYRWYYEADIDKAGEILPRWRAISAPEAEIQQRKKWICERQISRIGVVGSNDTTAPVIEASYRRFLAVFRELLEHQPFLMGRRPGASDFAAFGQLTQLVGFDPTPAAVTIEEAPRVYAWVDLVDDLSGLEPRNGDWIDREDLAPKLRPLLEELGRTYVPVMRANAEALQRGAEQVETEVEGERWVQKPFNYQGKCLAWVRGEYSALGNEDRSFVDDVLHGTGCEPLFEGL